MIDWLIDGPHWGKHWKQTVQIDSLTTQKVEGPTDCCSEHRKSGTAIAATITRLHQEASESEPIKMSEILSALAERGSPSRPCLWDKRSFTGFDRPTRIGEGVPFTADNQGRRRFHKLYTDEAFVSIPLNWFFPRGKWKTAFHKGWPHLSAGGTFYHFCFCWHWDKLSHVHFLTLKSHFSRDVSGRLSSLVSPLSAPLSACAHMSCGRRFCPSSDILCSCDLYSTPQPLSLFLPSCPIRFDPLVALAHCPFVSHAHRRKDRGAHEHAPG